MPLPARAILILIFAVLTAHAAEPIVEPCDERGTLTRVPLAGGWMEVHGEVAIPTKGWKQTWKLSAHEEVRRTQADGAVAWRGVLGEHRSFDVTQTLRRDGAALVLDVEVRAATADAPEIENPLWWLDLPASDWLGGTWRIDQRSGELPVQPRSEQERHLGGDDGSEIAFTSAAGKRGLVLTASEKIWPTLQDGRVWGPVFSALVPLVRDTSAAAPTWRLHLRIAGTGAVDAGPATVSLGAPGHEACGGLGGTWCFDLGAPTTARCRSLLASGWQRTEMDLSTLPEAPADAAPAAWAEGAVAALDIVGCEAAHLEITGAFVAQGLPVIVSAWKLPPWMLEGPLQESGNQVRAARWPFVVAAAVAWCRRARLHGGEPLAFSFNEPDLGVRIKLDPEQQHAMVLRLGAAFQAAGLKTRLSLGDVANPRGTASYCQPTADDPAARAYVACVAVHSWGGGSAAQWDAWRSLATRLGVPLVIAEVGPDSDAWRGNVFRRRSYQVAEARHLVEILRDAHPQSALRWQFTGDYDLLDDGHPTMRWAVWRWGIEALPKGAVWRAGTCDRPELAAVAAQLPGGGSLLVANSGCARSMRVTGLGDGTYHVARATPEEPWSRPADVAVTGEITLELPAESFTVLTSAALAATWDAPRRP